MQEPLGFVREYLVGSAERLLEWKVKMFDRPMIDDARIQLGYWASGNLGWSLSTSRYSGGLVLEAGMAKKVVLTRGAAWVLHI